MATKILVIDDHEISRKMFHAVIKQDRLEDVFTLIEAFDGLDGYEKILADAEIKFVICDLYMPRLTGLEMMSKINVVSPERLKTLKTFMFTTENDPVIKEEARNYNLTGWLGKPLDVRSFLRQIQSKYL